MIMNKIRKFFGIKVYCNLCTYVKECKNTNWDTIKYECEAHENRKFKKIKNEQSHIYMSYNDKEYTLIKKPEEININNECPYYRRKIYTGGFA